MVIQQDHMAQTRLILLPGILFSFILIILSCQVMRLEINNPRLINCVPYHTGKFYICNKMSLILALISLEPSHFLPIPRLCHTSPLPFHLSGWVSVIEKSPDEQDSPGSLSLQPRQFPPHALCCHVTCEQVSD